MELSMKDVMEIIDAPESAVLKFIKSGKLPAHKINHQYRFNKQDLKEWIIRNNISVSEKTIKNFFAEPVSLEGLLVRGGALTIKGGHDIREILKNAVSKMKMPPETTPEEVLSSLLEREEMMPTSIGMGIAIPHPRNPVISDVENESITMCMLEEPREYGSLDGKKVHTLFIIMSANPRRHLEILSKLVFICRRERFAGMLEERAGFEEICGYVGLMEKEMQAGKK